jgi:hypothetical protein
MISFTFDYLDRKCAIIMTTPMIDVGMILATASAGKTVEG